MKNLAKIPVRGLINLRFHLALANNQITDISPLAGLSNLQVLLLGSNQVTDIPPLSALTNLRYLWLDNNQISDISPLAGPGNLQMLVLGRNRISDLSPLAKLANLQDLALNHNEIEAIGALVTNAKNGGLGEGDTVDLRGNPLDLTPGSEAMAEIQELTENGVTVRYRP